MHFCYIDESGTPHIPGNTSHFVLAGVSIPIWHWHDADSEITRVLSRYGLEHEEFHTAWILRKYIEQTKIPGFEQMPYARRRAEVERHRTAELLRLQRGNNSKRYKQAKKTYRHTIDYVHLTLAERQALVRDVAETVSNWGFARLFAECIDKVYFDPTITKKEVGEQAFEQLVSRFETYLQKIDNPQHQRSYGLLVHDNNETVAKNLTRLMRHYQTEGTLWTNIERTIETPMFVDSSLTRMVQVADLCSYALRRYLENQEAELFDLIFERADRHQDVTVGVRHYCGHSCTCKICDNHSCA